MLEDLLGLVMIEEALEARERRLLLREQRRALRIETIRRIALSFVALAVAALTIAGVAAPH
jgi:putative Mn2+ efflux pump MntP